MIEIQSVPEFCDAMWCQPYYSSYFKMRSIFHCVCFLWCCVILATVTYCSCYFEMMSISTVWFLFIFKIHTGNYFRYTAHVWVCPYWPKYFWTDRLVRPHYNMRLCVYCAFDIFLLLFFFLFCLALYTEEVVMISCKTFCCNWKKKFYYSHWFK